MVNACELFIHFPEEVEYIWMLYLFARYFIFVLHIQVFLYGDVLQHVSPSQFSQSMRVWWVYKAVVFQAFLWVINFALMKRIYLLFDRKKWMLNFLCCISATKTATPSITGSVSIFILVNHQ
ncbi:hypothetical protein BDZ97DRAFT_1801826 [Flammula alnicola]|nr:hypothetical protein BDZ97DRAFT_1801826 [Flammula alnicola]